jgi:hypothetical protein
VAKSANAIVSNTIVRKDLWVQVPPAAPDDFVQRPPCRAIPPDPVACVDDRGLGASYVYLLGMYLGDGTISSHPKNVWRLRIFTHRQYTEIVSAIKCAIYEVTGRPAGHLPNRNWRCDEISSCWKHWPCVIPQPGPGPKHLRPIRLEEWQRDLVVQHPRELVAGLIQSDGCRVTDRVTNRAGRHYEYPRYFFTNHSLDIHAIFVEACTMIGVECRPDGPWNISVAKKASVAILDEFIGPKRLGTPAAAPRRRTVRW